MSYCRKEGKDVIIFATKENHEVPSTVQLPEPERPPGLILPDGSINWNCPCLGGMATGPCGIEFRDAFSCFHYSKEEPKGSDCLNKFQNMQECMKQYPTLYESAQDDDIFDSNDDDSKDEEKEIGDNKKMSVSSSKNTTVNTSNEKK